MYEAWAMCAESCMLVLLFNFSVFVFVALRDGFIMSWHHCTLACMQRQGHAYRGYVPDRLAARAVAALSDWRHLKLSDVLFKTSCHAHAGLPNMHPQRNSLTADFKGNLRL